jgi:hypothetical protein
MEPRIPSNRIVTGSYTAGKDYIYKESKNFYKGHFYKLNGSFYAGKEYKEDAPEIVKIPPKPNPWNDPNSLKYAVLKGAQAGLQAGLSAARTPTRPTKAGGAVASILAANQQGLIAKTAASTELEPEENQQITEQGQVNQENLTPVDKKRYFLRKLVKTKPNEYKFSELPNEREYEKAKDASRILKSQKVAEVTETSVPGSPPEFNRDELDKAEGIMPGLKVFLGIEVEQETA